MRDARTVICVVASGIQSPRFDSQFFPKFFSDPCQILSIGAVNPGRRCDSLRECAQNTERCTFAGLVPIWSAATGKSGNPTLSDRMASAELTLAELQGLVTAAVKANTAIAEAGQANAARLMEITTKLDMLTSTTTELSTASKRVETTLDHVLQANTALDRSVEELKQSMSSVAKCITHLEAQTPPGATPTPADLGTGMLRPHGHRLQPYPQGVGTGEVRTSGHALVRGEPSAIRDAEYNFSDDDADPHMHTPHQHHNFGPRLPKSDFPTFDGDNPKW